MALKIKITQISKTEASLIVNAMLLDGTKPIQSKEFYFENVEVTEEEINQKIKEWGDGFKNFDEKQKELTSLVGKEIIL